jgi:hypothetical protein
MKATVTLELLERSHIPRRAAHLELKATSTRDDAWRQAIAPGIQGVRCRPTVLVGVLAFVQSLVFLLLWLILCATAGAVTQPAPDFKPQIQKSTYAPTKTRDPFLRAGAAVETKSTPVSSFVFKLQGILYQPSDPAAIVNDQLVRLNKTVSLEDPNSSIEVKAVEITRDRVVLQVRGQRVELQLNPQEIKP